MAAPERIVTRQITVYERERQCLARDCGIWFRPKIEIQQWCCRRCRDRATHDRIAREKREARATSESKGASKGGSR